MAAFPVYNICNLAENNALNNTSEILVEKLDSYIGKHYDRLSHPHRHSFYHIVLFTQGEGKHTIDFKTFPVKAAQVYCMVPGQVHSWLFKNSVEGYVINFSETYFKSFLLNAHYLDRFPFFSGSCDDGVIQLNTAYTSLALTLFGEMEQMVQEEAVQEDLIKVLLLRLLLLLEKASENKVPAAVPKQKMLVLKTFKNLIEKNYRELRLPGEYASLMYITPHHLNALCRDLTGKSAGEMIRDRVLLEARRLLINVQMSAAQIAAVLNFKDASYFTRFFKKNTGLTPFEFRKQLQ